MKRFNTGMWLAGLVASSIAIFPLACGPVEDSTGPSESLDEPQLADQVQESPGGSLGNRLGRPVALGTTVGKTDDLVRPCEGSPPATPDMTYTWTAPFTGRFTFTTQGSELDTVLLVRDASDANTLRGCNDEAFSRSGWSRIEDLPLTGGMLYNITVEGWRDGVVGNFVLNISSKDATTCGTCNAPPNTCYQWDNTCVEGACGYATKSLGASCDDGNFCTVSELCDGRGTCGGGTARTCNTPNGCQEANGTCSNNQCNYPPKSAGTSCDDGNFCSLNDVCNGSGACGGGTTRTCNTSPSQCHQSTGTCSGNQCNYSLKPTGSSCDDGNSCTDNDQCNSTGTCAGSPRVCTQSSNACEQINGTCSNGVCSFPAMPQGTPCNDGIACTSGDACNGAKQCVGTVQCSINGACFPNGATNPANQCQVCDTTRSTTAWSNKSSGAACNDGITCTVNDACNGAGACGGTVQCSINGACFPNGATNPANQCQVCDTARSTTAWSNKGAGVSCNDGITCTVNDACNGAGACGGTVQCSINGACFANGATNPANQCQVCDTARSTTAWSNKAFGSTCNDGLSCTSGERCNGAGSCIKSAEDCEPSSECWRWAGTCSASGACEFEDNCGPGMYCRSGRSCEPDP